MKMTRHTIRLIAGACLIAFPIQSRADTHVSGTLSGATWSKAGSPYILDATVTVPSGYTLTVDAGVVVKSASTAKLVIQGRIVATGNGSDPVLFTASNSSWLGITLSFADASSVLDRCILEKASNEVVTLDNCSCTIRNCTVRDSIGAGVTYPCTGIRLTSSSPGITECSFVNNSASSASGYDIGAALKIDGNSHPRIRNCLFANNSGAYIVANNFSNGYFLMEQCTFANNRCNYVLSTTQGSSIRNCVFSGNRDYSNGIHTFGSAGTYPAPDYISMEDSYSHGAHVTIGAATFKNPTTIAGAIGFPLEQTMG
jgi:hypothetical protein